MIRELTREQWDEFDRFLSLIEERARDKPFAFRIRPGVVEIRDCDGDCPLVSVARWKFNFVLSNGYYDRAGQLIGLSPAVFNVIAVAADGYRHCQSVAVPELAILVQHKLAKAVGLHDVMPEQS